MEYHLSILSDFQKNLKTVVEHKQVSTNASTLLNLIYVLVFTNLNITFIFL